MIWRGLSVVGSQREISEVGSQKSEVRGQKSEVRSQRSEVRSRRSEVSGQLSAVSWSWVIGVTDLCGKKVGTTSR